jgi:hypothetical protein
MPLSNKKLKKEHYRQLINKVKSKLPGWKASLLSPGGRTILMNSTLLSVPIFFMSTFLLPTWIIKELDKVRRRFLWHGHKESTTGRYMSPIAWDLVKRPKNII